MTQPTLPILGCPNVGKSTLFNRLLGKRQAIVLDRPGVTHDCQEGTLKLGKAACTLVDTPGLWDTTKDNLESRLKDITQPFIDRAPFVLFVLDGKRPLGAEEKAFAHWLRKQGKPTLLIVNKCDGNKKPDTLLEAYELGFEDIIPISAEHGEGTTEVQHLIRLKLEEEGALATQEKEESGRPLQLAIVGRPNVGKSTLTNCLLGQKRMLTGAEAGLTRDTVASSWEHSGRAITLFDTAGLQKMRHKKMSLDAMARDQALHAIRFAQVVVVMMDAEDPFLHQDLVITNYVIQEGRALVIALNKWDRIRKPKETLAALQKRADTVFPQIAGVSLVPISALNSKGVSTLLKAVLRTEKIWRSRVPTGRLNSFLEYKLARHPPPMIKGRRIKLKYLSQIKTAPPTFALFGSQAKALPTSYQSYLLKGLREEFGLQGVPLRLILKAPENPYA